MRVELRFFASFREAVGRKVLEWEDDEDGILVGDLLTELDQEYPEFTVFEEDGSLRGFVNVLKNGRDINFLEGLETELEDGDVLSVFPPVAGGGHTEMVRSFRGITPRIARHYLEQLGGDELDEETVAGRNWRASLASRPVSVGPTLQLTEVTVRFEGEADEIEDLIETFSQKAMRAGG